MCNVYYFVILLSNGSKIFSWFNLIGEESLKSRVHFLVMFQEKNVPPFHDKFVNRFLRNSALVSQDKNADPWNARFPDRNVQQFHGNSAAVFPASSVPVFQDKVVYQFQEGKLLNKFVFQKRTVPLSLCLVLFFLNL